MAIVVVRRSPGAADTHLQQSLDPCVTYCGLSLKDPAPVPGGGYVSCALCVRNNLRARNIGPWDDPLVPDDANEQDT